MISKVIVFLSISLLGTLSACSSQDLENPALHEDVTTESADDLNVKTYLTFPGASKTILTSTTTDPNVFYTDILAGRSWGRCLRTLDGKSLLVVRTYFANRTFTKAESIYNSRDCSGIRVSTHSLLAQNRVVAFVATAVPGVWFLEGIKLPTASANAALQLKNGQLHTGGSYNRATQVTEANFAVFATDTLIR